MNLNKILRHPMLTEPIVAPRVVIDLIVVVLAAVGVEVAPVEALEAFTAADVLIAGGGVAFAHIAQAFKARAQTDSPATLAALEAERQAELAALRVAPGGFSLRDNDGVVPHTGDMPEMNRDV